MTCIRKPCFCPLCFMIFDKLSNGEASQIRELEEDEVKHLDAHYYQTNDDEIPSARKQILYATPSNEK